jgi:hypothetical protein
MSQNLTNDFVIIFMSSVTLTYTSLDFIKIIDHENKGIFY